MVAVIEFQHTFSDDDLEHSGLADVEPTDAAMQALVLRLEQALRQFNPRRVELEADVEMEEGDSQPDLSWNSGT
jgi:hypothetical protein